MSFKSGISNNLACRALPTLPKGPLVPMIIGPSKIVAQIQDTPPRWGYVRSQRRELSIFEALGQALLPAFDLFADLFRRR
jgi:hypothetical protein